MRVFDLGGGGLKTALAGFSHDGLLVLEAVRNLGKVPVDKKVYKWVREKIPTFSAEKNSGGAIKFGASLAGLDKLWVDKQEHEMGTFEQLVRADASHRGPGVTRLHDGTAHLTASKHMVPEVAYPLCNVAIGTGITIDLTNSSGEIRNENEMRRFFGREDSWNFQVECEGQEKPMYKAFGGNFDGGRGQTARQTARWVRFIRGRLAERFTAMEWTPPACYTFTGGVAEHSRLVAELQEQGLPILKGPSNAGLMGAALAALSVEQRRALGAPRRAPQRVVPRAVPRVVHARAVRNPSPPPHRDTCTCGDYMPAYRSHLAPCRNCQHIDRIYE